MFEIEIYNKTDGDEWNKLVCKSQNPSTFQLFEWGEYQKESDGCRPIRVLIKKDGQVKLLAQAILKRLPKLKSNIIGVLHGPVLLTNNEDASELLEFFIKQIKKIAIKENVAFIRFNPNLACNPFDKIKKDKFKQLKKRFSMLYYTTTLEVDLTKDISEIRNQFAKRTRNAINKAKKVGLEIRSDASEKILKDFYNLFHETTTRKKLDYMPEFSYVKNIWDKLSKQGIAKIFVVYYQHIPLGGAFIVCSGHKCHYLWGGSSQKLREKNANQYLHYQIIKWAKEEGYKKYDFGGIRDKVVKHGPGFGIYLFKSGFGGEEVKYMKAVDFILKPFVYHVLLLNGNTIIWKNKLRKIVKKLDIKEKVTKLVITPGKWVLFRKHTNKIYKVFAKVFEIFVMKFAKHKYASLLFLKTNPTLIDDKSPITLSFDCDLDEDILALPKLLQILERTKVKASFACIGKLIEKYPNEHLQIVQNGHEIINHSYSHPNHKTFNPNERFLSISKEKRIEEIRKCDEVCQKLLNCKPVGFRAPHFLFTKDSYRILADLDYKYSSSIFMSRAKKFGQPYFADKIVEFPMTACLKYPLTCMSSARVFRGDAEKYNGEDEYFELMKKVIEKGIESKMYLNFYFDPCDVVKMNNFENLLNFVQEKQTLRLITYNELTEIIEKQQVC